VVTRDGDLNGDLTAREHEVLELVGAGLAEEQIADRLRIAHSTVALLLRSAMGKLDAHTRVEAAAKLRLS
jgi:LuxR family transcriptional regulator, regulator of acetate metabolism